MTKESFIKQYEEACCLEERLQLAERFVSDLTIETLACIRYYVNTHDILKLEFYNVGDLSKVLPILNKYFLPPNIFYNPEDFSLCCNMPCTTGRELEFQKFYEGTK